MHVTSHSNVTSILQLVFSPKRHGKECWLYFISDDHQVTHMGVDIDLDDLSY